MEIHENSFNAISNSIKSLLINPKIDKRNFIFNEQHIATQICFSVQKSHIFYEVIELLFPKTRSVIILYFMLLTNLSAQIESHTTIEAEERSSNTLVKVLTALHIRDFLLQVNIG